jgi:hypothetical protein
MVVGSVIFIPQSQRQTVMRLSNADFGDAGAACGDEERKRGRGEVYIDVPRLKMRRR